MIEEYIENIKNLNPVPENQGFKFLLKNWEGHIEDKSVLSNVAQLDGQDINRQMVVEAYRKYFNDKKDVSVPFLYTMIWGFGNAGYGAFRTNKYLSSENKGFIIKALDFVDNEQIEKAFEELNNIKGMGISFASKVLYFAGKAKDIKGYPLIFDNRVAHSLVSILSKEVAEMLNISPKVQWKTYNNYNEMLHNWADKYSLKADWIELFLFNQEF